VAKPQLENGYTRLANEIVDAFVRLHLSGNEWQVLWFIIRKTYGFNKKVDRIVNFQICEATNLHKSVVSRILKKLANNKIIYYNGHRVGFQKDWELWPIEYQTKLLTEISTFKPNKVNKLTKNKVELTEMSIKVDSPLVTQKTKDNIQKTIPHSGVKEVLDFISNETGEKAIHYAKEGSEIKLALKNGYTVEEIIGCWGKMKNWDFWSGKWLPLAKVVENLGAYRGGGLSDGKKKARRVDGGHKASDFDRTF